MKATKESLLLTQNISNAINNQTMHHHYHVLYDIAQTYPSEQHLNYVEIGCYAGGSACLMLQRPKTHVISIDLGTPIPESIVRNNVERLNPNKNSFDYLQGNSQTHQMVTRLKNIISKVDILFIDGDHSYQAVINDFMLYSGLVKPGGYIVFDDYRDSSIVHNTSKAVDDIVDNQKSRYNIIGTLPNKFGARPIEKKEGNDFIIQKK